MTREEAFAEINQTQEYYIQQLIDLMNNPNYTTMKSLNFQSATGTGKTNMMSLLINKFPDYYFIITTLSKGQLHIQIRDNLKKLSLYDNFYVYGSADYKINSRLDADDIIGKIPDGKKCIWLRDEGHIKTNRWDALLENVCYKVINFSATNDYADVQCNFAHTMMLRTVNQTVGTPEDAIQKLLEVKQQHSKVPNYNPCAIFRCVGGDANLYQMIVSLCNAYGLKYTDLSEDEYVMADLCRDDNEYDVLINKFKIVEGIDIRRAHILYMDNQPNNNKTTIQVIGRCRRNALLYRDDIDILAEENRDLLETTRECYVYYNVEKMKIDTDENGELQMAFCNIISCQELKPNITISVKNGQLSNGLFVIELEGLTGKFTIEVDKDTGFNVVTPITKFYDTEDKSTDDYVYVYSGFDYDRDYVTQKLYMRDLRKIHKTNLSKLKTSTEGYERYFDYSKGEYEYRDITVPTHYVVPDCCGENIDTVAFEPSNELLCAYNALITKYSDEFLSALLTERNIENIVPDAIPSNYVVNKYVNNYIEQNKTLIHQQYATLENLEHYYAGGLSELCWHHNKSSMNILKYYYIKLIEQGYTKKEINAKIREYNSKITVLCYDDSLPSSIIDRKLAYLLLFNDDICFAHLKKHYFISIPYYQSDNPITLINQTILQIIKDYEERLNKIMVSGVSINCKQEHRQIKEQLDSLGLIISNKEARVFYDYSAIIEPLSDEEYYLITKGAIVPYCRPYITLTVDNIKSPYTKIVNDKESAIIGVDVMRQIKQDDEVCWVESKSVSSKVGGYNKLNEFISNRYSDELQIAKAQLFSGKNSYDLDNKCNSCLGYCVEYYSKYLLYGEVFLEKEIRQAKQESHTTAVNEALIVRACMLKYRQMMALCYGSYVAKIIKTISVEQLIKDKYKDFVKLVIELGTATSKYVKETLYKDQFPQNNIDPNLSIRHISGLADYITEDTILDVKVQNHIDEKMIRQVLAYHYLSTKRSDLNIKRVIVYDATSNKSVIIPISEKNIKQG